MQLPTVAQVIIRRGHVLDEEVETFSALNLAQQLLLLRAVKSQALSQDEADTAARELNALVKQPDNPEAQTALNQRMTNLEHLVKAAEDAPPSARLSAGAKPASAADADIDQLDNVQRRAVLQSVASGALPAGEALDLMKDYLDVELKRTAKSASTTP
ncbi:uncharacterized protein MONBRDRAFT_32559, partial [Monosiga brevicollis MX1]